MTTFADLHPREAVTMEELLDESYVVQLHERKDLAFVYDGWNETLLLTLETGKRHVCLPNVPYSPAAGFENVGHHRIWTSLQVPRALAAWLNRCRDAGAIARMASPECLAWWADGVRRIRPDEVAVLLGVP